MKLLSASCLVAALGVAGAFSLRHTEQPAPVAEPRLAYGRLPLAFVPNQGQLDERVLFVARSPLANAFLTQEGPVFALKGDKQSPSFRMRLVGARAAASVTAEAPLPGEVNELLGNDPAKWRTHLALFGQVRYREVYPGVDLVFHGSPQRMEYDFEVAAGADPAAVRVQFEGAEDVRVDDNGELVLTVAGRELRQGRPIIYQSIDGQRREVGGAYVLRGSELAFAVDGYDARHALVIDPVLQYSTYLGGTADEGVSITVDGAGNAYLAGYTRSTDFPVANALQGANAGMSDVVIAKLSPTGTLVFATYLGGTNEDQARAIALDSSGNILITGKTESTNYPTVNPAQGPAGNTGSNFSDAFITKLNPGGSSLLYSTYLGGAAQIEEGSAIAVDGSGNAYVAGFADGTFPTVNAALSCSSNYDAWIAKLSPSGAIVFSRCLAGNALDAARGVALDGAGNVYVAGYTSSTTFPKTANAYQPARAGTFSNSDIFLTRLNPVDGGVEYSTYFGGGRDDQANALAVDSAGNAYLTGNSFAQSGPNFPTLNAFMSSPAGGVFDAVVAKFWADGGLAYSTYVGGTGNDDAYGIAVNAAGNAYVTGTTDSVDFPTLNPLQANNRGTNDGYVLELSPSGSSLVYSTYFGGSGYENSGSVALDSAGNVYIAGATLSTDLATVNAAQSSFSGGNGDGFIARLDFRAPLLTSVAPSFGTTAGGDMVTLTGSQFAPGATLTWGGTSNPVSFLSNNSLSTVAPAHAAGPVSIVVTNPDGRTAYLDGGYTYYAPPVVSSVTPGNGPASGGRAVTISGSNFATGATVTMGGAAATNVTVVNANTITATSPAHLAGSVAVVVINPPGVSGSKANAFTYDPPPTFSNIAPQVGPASGGTTIDITGTNFVAGASVLLDGVAATNVSVVSATHITATTPAHVAAVVDVKVQNADGQSVTQTGAFTYEPAPIVSSVTLTYGSTAGGETVSVTGSNFKSGAQVRFGGVAGTSVNVVSPTQLIVITPAHAAGFADVVVQNPDGQSGTKSSGYEFVVPPVVTQVAPTVGPVTGGTSLTITGSAFTPGTTVKFGTTAAASVVVVSSSQLTVTTPAHVAGAVNVVAVSPQGLNGPPLTNAFNFLDAPTVTSVSPTTGTGSGGTAVTITGTNFFTGAVVYFGGVVATNINVVSATTITATTPAHAQGPVNVVVTNPDAQTAQLAAAFSYDALAPSVQAVSPNSGPIAGGTVITVSGSAFVNGATVTLDGVAATNVTVQSDTVISATVPAHAAGAVEVRVTNPDAQTNALANGFTYLAPPSVTGISPSSGPASGGTSVTLSGAEFRTGATVLFGGSLATVTANEANALTVTTPSHAAGPVDVIVSNTDGQQSAAVTFTYVAPPAITSLTPNIGSSVGGTAVTVAGSGFEKGATLTFGGEPATEVIVVDANTVTAVTPAHSAERVDVVISNPDGQSGTAALGYEYSDVCATCQKPVSQYAFGCATGGGELAFGWLMALVLPALRRRRSARRG